MAKLPLDIYDDMPPLMKRYISNNGWHFNKKAYEYAAKLMKKRNAVTGKLETVEAFTKDQIDELLTKNEVKLDNAVMYDYVYVAQIAKADLYKSIPDEQHLALYVKDVIDDVDTSPETTFRCWTAKMVGNGDPIDWEEIL